MQSIPPQDTPALAVEHLSKSYRQWQRGTGVKDALKNLIHPQKRSVLALDDLSLRVAQGEFVAYAGANGAGKSTTIKLLAGILRPSGGQVRVLGMDPAASRVKLMRRVGVLFGQRSELWWDFPVIASLEWKKAVWDIDDATYARMLATVTEMLDLGPLLNTFARELSLGQRMRADLGMLLLHDPQVIFLDEPTLGLDLLAKRQLIAFLKHVNASRGTTILVTSHDMDDLQEMARRMVLLSHGRLAFDGSFEALKAADGGRTTVKLTAEGEPPPPAEGIKLVRRQGDEMVFTVDQQAARLGTFLAGLASLGNIRDIEIQPPSIEDVIAGLYQAWEREYAANGHRAPEASPRSDNLIDAKCDMT